MNRILTVFFLLISLGLSAQQPPTKVMVCLYERIDFSTDFPLTEIGNINAIGELEVYDSLTALLSAVLERYSSMSIVFDVLSPEQSYYFTKRATKSDLDNPSHYGIDLSSINNREYSVFMNQHNADYVLFVNYYSIKKYRIPEADMEAFKRVVSPDELYLIEQVSKKRPIYSEHLIDFDFYDQYKNRFLSKGRYAIPILRYNPRTLGKKGLDFETIEKTYGELANKLYSELAKEIQNKEEEENH